MAFCFQDVIYRIQVVQMLRLGNSGDVLILRVLYFLDQLTLIVEKNIVNS